MKKAVIVFILALAVLASCTGQNSNSAQIVGTWVLDEFEVQYKNDGSFESSSDGNPVSKGTYTTNANNLTIIITHTDITKSEAENLGLESKLYTKNELLEFFGDKGHYDSSSGILTYTVGRKAYYFYFTSETTTYLINGNTLTLIIYEFDEDVGEIETFTKKQTGNSKNKGLTKVKKITEKDLIGVWELVGVAGISKEETSYKDEYFNDGTAISVQEGQTVSLTWKLRDGNRIQADYIGGMQSQISDVELSEDGTWLTWYFDDEHTEKALYRKK